MRWTRLSWLLLGVLSIVPGAARGQDYHPLTPGLTWRYENASGSVLDVSMLGTEEIDAETTYLRREIYPDQVVLNYWTREVDGTLLLHGARNLTFRYRAYYDPPIHMLEAPFLSGHTWGPTVVTVCDETGGGGSCDEVSYTGEVVAVNESLTVPNGTYSAAGVQIALAPVGVSALAPFDVLGRYVELTGRSGAADTDWYSDGTGIVRQEWAFSGEVWDLHETGTTTPVTRVRWSDVKARYVVP